MNIELLPANEPLKRPDKSGEIKERVPKIKGDLNPNRVDNELAGSAQNQSAIASPKLELLYDKTTGLLQSIIKDPVNDNIIRKMPSDEYLKLMQLATGGNHLNDEV